MSAPDDFFGDFFDQIGRKDQTISRAPKEAFGKTLPPVRNLGADHDDDQPASARQPAVGGGAPRSAEHDKGKHRKHAYEYFNEWDRFDVDKELSKMDADEAAAAAAASGGQSAELIAGLLPSEVPKLPEERRLALALDEKTKGNESFHAREWQRAIRHYTHSLILDQSSAAVCVRAVRSIADGSADPNCAPRRCAPFLRAIRAPGRVVGRPPPALARGSCARARARAARRPPPSAARHWPAWR